jgi:hypothetical protein
VIEYVTPGVAVNVPAKNPPAPPPPPVNAPPPPPPAANKYVRVYGPFPVNIP